MRRIILTVIILALLVTLGIGCLPRLPIITSSPQEPSAKPSVQETVKPVNITTPGSIGVGDAIIWVGTDQGLFGGKGYYPGARAEHVIPIYNNYPQDIQVELLYSCSKLC